MDNIPLKLVCEKPEFDIKDFTIIESSENTGAEKNLFIQGPYTVANSRNKNKRIYPLEEMVSQVSEFSKEKINKGIAYGELEHPEYPDVKLSEAAHLIKELSQDGNTFIGKSKILSTPKGQIIKSIIKDGGNLGISSRALGNVDRDGYVRQFLLCTFDVVADPSCQTAFVNGILENKEWICSYDEENERVYKLFEDKLSTLPNKERESYLTEAVVQFLRALSQSH